MSSNWAKAAVLVGVAIASASAVALASVMLGSESRSASKADYQATIVSARDRVDFALMDISKQESLDDLVQELERASVAVEGVASDLATAGVAEGFREQNDKLVDALVGLSSELSGTAATIGDPSFSEALPHLTSLSFKQWTVVNRILGELKSQGIDVEPLSRH